MKKLLFFICLISLNAYSQDIKVETIMFDESKVPHVVDVNGNQNEVIIKINEFIKEEFMIDSFNPDENENFRWYDLSYEHEIKDDILLISYEGEYAAGAGPSYSVENLFFDLSNGKSLENLTIPFCSLFSIDGYFDFLNKYWIQGCSKEMKIAEECGDAELYCSLLDIEYRIEDGHLVSYLTNDCFPRVIRACTPNFSVKVHQDSLKPYLSEFGESVMFNTEYVNGSILDKFIFTTKNLEKASKNYFIIGKIDGKYNFSMAITQHDDSNSASGYYYYNKSKVKIPLNGTYNADEIKTSESLNGEITGHIELYWHDFYQKGGVSAGNKFLTGKWLSPERDKVMYIVFERVKVTKK